MVIHNQEEGMDLITIFNKILENWYLFVAAFALFLTLGYVYNRISNKIYKTQGILRYNTSISKTEKILSDIGIQEKTVNIEDEVIAIKSANYIKEALDLLDFNISYFSKGDIVSRERYKNEFPLRVTLADSSMYQITDIPIWINILSSEEFEITVKGKEVYSYNLLEDLHEIKPIPEIDYENRYRFGQPIREPFLGLTITLTGDPGLYGRDKLFIVIHSPKKLVEKYLDKLVVEPGGRISNILKLSIEGSVVQKDIEFLNTLMEMIIQKDLEEKNQENINTINFIDYQLANISDSLYKAERAMESYQFSATSIGESGLLYARRDQLESQSADIRLKLSYLQSILSNIETMDGVANISAPASVGIDDPLLSTLLIRLAELNQQRVQLGRTATSANPIIQRIDLEIASAKVAIQENISEAVSSTTMALNDINNRLRETNATINRLPGSEVRKLGVERKFQFSDNTYDLLLQRKAAAGIALATTVSNWNIVDRARLLDDTPVSPKKSFIFFIALFLGFVFPASFILLREALNFTIKSRKDIELITNIPVIGSVTRGQKYTKLVSECDPKSPLVESLRSVQMNLQYILPKDSYKSILITSSISGEGKTFCAINLSIVLAQSGKKVVLIDADMRKSKMSDFFKADSKTGLSSYLVGGSTLQESITKSQIDNLDLIFAGAPPPNPFELLNMPRMDVLISELKEKYDFLIIDTAPFGLVSDYVYLLKYATASIYVTRYNYTNKKLLENINDFYEQGKVKNLSILLNGIGFKSMYGSTSYNNKNYFS